MIVLLVDTYEARGFPNFTPANRHGVGQEVSRLRPPERCNRNQLFFDELNQGVNNVTFVQSERCKQTV